MENGNAILNPVSIRKYMMKLFPRFKKAKLGEKLAGYNP